MTDQIDKMKTIFEDKSVIKAPEHAKKMAIAAAIRTFEEEHKSKAANDHQVKQSSSRWWNVIKFPYWVSAAVVGVFALSIFVINPRMQQNVSFLDLEEVLDEPLLTLNAGDADLQAANMELEKLQAAREKQANEAIEGLGMTKSLLSLTKPALTSNDNELGSRGEIAQALSGFSVPFLPEGSYGSVHGNRLQLTSKDPISTPPINVGSSSYSAIRNALNRNLLPRKDDVRVEELINHFPYDYPAHKQNHHRFRAMTTVMPTLWNENTKLLHISIKGYEFPKVPKSKSNLVFLIDTSDSMQQANKLPMIIKSLEALLETLQPEDIVSIVTEKGADGVVLKPTRVKDKDKIIQTLKQLRAGGGVRYNDSVRIAYNLAKKNYDDKAFNRVILVSDGGFDVGNTTSSILKTRINFERELGISLSVIGFGSPDQSDALFQMIARAGKRKVAYIDSWPEAKNIFIKEVFSTSFPIAEDVKIQIEFNPQIVSQYRLIGYDSPVEIPKGSIAGYIREGHTVTVLYEITPVDPLDRKKNYGVIQIDYKLPTKHENKTMIKPIIVEDTYKTIDKVSIDIRFAAAVAAFGQLLQRGSYMGDYNYDDVYKLARSSKGLDPHGVRAEFIKLVFSVLALSK